MKRLLDSYQKLFSLHEINKDLAIRLFGAAILLGFIVSFKGWESSYLSTLNAANNGDAICWPMFQGCYDLFFMNRRPHGYIQNTIFMSMLGLIFVAAYGLIAKKYVTAHFCILILFIWKAYLTSINYMANGNFDYYHTAFTFIFLFLPHKRFFGSLSIPLFYFLSTATKIHEGWTLGTYFTSMVTDLPLFPDGTTMLWTNMVILMEMVGAWFLFSKHKHIQKTVFAFFVIFHLYSGTLVGYHYPLIVTPALLIFFGPLYKPFHSVPLDRKAIAGWLLMCCLVSAQMISHVIPGDEKLTFEGNFYGLYMFEANHQCSILMTNENGDIVYRADTTSARNRCDPYNYMFRGQKKFCQGETQSKISFKQTHSINGGPFYLIVDEADLCALEYKPFSRNRWIKTEDEAKATARPRENYYR